MNKVVRSLLFMGVLSLGLASCGKKDTPLVQPTPTPAPAPAPKPAPPVVEAHFSKAELTVALGSVASTTLEGFKGTLTQEGTVEGFKVTIEGNAITIAPEQYLPGEHTFAFKGEGKTYKLKLTLQKLPDHTEAYGVFTLSGEKVIDAKFVSKKFNPKDKSITLVMMSETQNTPNAGPYIIISKVKQEKHIVTFSIQTKAVKPLANGDVYFDGDVKEEVKGIRTSAEGVSPLRIFATLKNGKHLDLIVPTK